MAETEGHGHNTQGSVDRDTSESLQGDDLRSAQADTASGGAPEEPDSDLSRELVGDDSGEGQP